MATRIWCTASTASPASSAGRLPRKCARQLRIRPAIASSSVISGRSAGSCARAGWGGSADRSAWPRSALLRRPSVTGNASTSSSPSPNKAAGAPDFNSSSISAVGSRRSPANRNPSSKATSIAAPFVSTVRAARRISEPKRGLRGFDPVRSVTSRAIASSNSERSGSPEGEETSVSCRSKAPRSSEAARLSPITQPPSTCRTRNATRARERSPSSSSKYTDRSSRHVGGPASPPRNGADTAAFSVLRSAMNLSSRSTPGGACPDPPSCASVWRVMRTLVRPAPLAAGPLQSRATLPGHHALRLRQINAPAGARAARASIPRPPHLASDRSALAPAAEAPYMSGTRPKE